MDENYELILHLLKMNYPERDFEAMEESDVYEWFYDHYGIVGDEFNNLIRDLLPLCTIAKSELTNTYYRGFGAENLWLLKQQIKL